ncbi:MAG: hypothetical protein V3R84_10435 [Acidimicrobiia bacterium]
MVPFLGISIALGLAFLGGSCVIGLALFGGSRMLKLALGIFSLASIQTLLLVAFTLFQPLAFVTVGSLFVSLHEAPVLRRRWKGKPATSIASPQRGRSQ